MRDSIIRKNIVNLRIVEYWNATTMGNDAILVHDMEVKRNLLAESPARE